MRANALEELLRQIVNAHQQGDEQVMKNLIVKGQIVLSRTNDASVLRELLNS